jgi:hypothetical protein
MSSTTTTHTSAALRDRRPWPAWLRGLVAGAVTLAVVLAAAVVFWPVSAADRARDDGEQVGRAVVRLSEAQSAGEVDAALGDLRTALADTRDHAGDAVADQASAQADALDRAVEGFAGTHASDDAFSVDLYRAELNTALDDLEGQAADFRDEGSDVQQAFWDGYASVVGVS